MLEDVEPRHEQYFQKESKLFNDLAQGSSFTFRKGDKWAINPETGEATFDPGFFEDKGYTPRHALFASAHELRSHLVELNRLLVEPGGKEAHAKLKAQVAVSERAQIWENCRQDIKGNKEILGLAPAMEQDVQELYADKLWPETDFTNLPQHLQFMYAILRGSMVPDQATQIDQEVKDAIDSLRDVKGKDVIGLCTDPKQSPLLGLMLSQKYIVPVIDSLFDEDLKKQKKDKNSDTGGKAKKDSKDKAGQSDKKDKNNSDEVFRKEYDDYKEKHPEPSDHEETEQAVMDRIDFQSEYKGYKDAYEKEHGVNKKDTADYYEEYKSVEPYIQELREIFMRITEQRKAPARRLVSQKEEGVMVDPGLITQTHIDLATGFTDPKTMMDMEGTFIDQNVPRSFGFHLVADQSSSMAGEKARSQRKAAVLIMEALEELSEKLREEVSENGTPLSIETELRSFGYEGTKLYKPLSGELSERSRIDYFKGLLQTPGGTNDFDSLQEITDDISVRAGKDPNLLSDLKTGKRKEIVVVLSDGGSNNAKLVQERANNLRRLGVTVIGLGMTNSASDIQKTYAPDGRICYDIKDLPKSLQEILVSQLGMLSTTGRSEDVLN